MCKPLINCVCSVNLEQLNKKKLVSLGAPWPAWTLNLARVRKAQAMGSLGKKKVEFLWKKDKSWERQCSENPGFVFVHPPVVEPEVKQKPEMDLAELPKTASLEQVTNLMRDLKQQDVCDMEVDLEEVMWQESDASL